MSEQFFYPIIVVELPEDDGGGYLGYLPDLPGCMSDGPTPEEAFANARQAEKEWIEDAREQGRDVPKPGSCAATAQQTRERFVKTIQEQRATIEEMDKDLAGMREALEAMSEKIEKFSEQPVWGNPVAYVAARRQKEDSVH
jgi:antitoxin HicB